MAENAILVRLLGHSLWANDQMLGACSGLTRAQLETDVVGTFGQLSQTLIHLARAQGGYLRTLTGWEPGEEHRLEYDAPLPGVARVAAHLRFTGERLVEVARDASPERVLAGVRNAEPYRIPEWVVLMQAVQHATEHRQQVATALTVLGVEPPEPDLWAFWEAIEPAEG